MAPNRLPARTLDEVIAAYPSLRQSILGRAQECLLSTRFDLEGYAYNNAAQARGIIFHAYAAKLLTVLRETGQTKIPTQEAMELLYEAAAQRDVPDDEVVTMGMADRRYLRICALVLAGQEFKDMHRLIAVERRLFTTVTYEGADGQVVQRQITGQPDALFADPPDGALVPDFKTTKAAPPKYTGRGKDPSEDEGGDPAHVSYEGYWQQRFYALLVMDNYPSVKHVTLREVYPGAKKEDDQIATREATVTRAALEHVRREIGDVVALLDRAIAGGHDSKVWGPSPGKHCNFCRRPSSCTIEKEARLKEEGITSDEQAARVAGVFVLADQLRDTTRKALKARYEATGKPIPVKTSKGRAELRKADGTQGNFGLCVPEPPSLDIDPVLDAVLAEAKAR